MSLLSLELSSNSSSFDDFFSVMPSIEQSSSDELDQPITIKELYVAVSSLQSGKSPGPDEYPVEFYKVFWICFMNNWKKAFYLRPSVRLLSSSEIKTRTH